MKKKLLLFSYVVNILMVILFVISIFAMFLRMKDFLDYVFFDRFFINIRMVLNIPILFLWFNNLIIWNKKDKGIKRFLALFFLNALYSPIYFRKVLMNNWL